LARRIDRTRHDILDKLKSGDYASVGAAAKAAGIIKEPTPLQRAQTAWRHASLDDKLAIWRWLDEQVLQDDALREWCICELTPRMWMWHLANIDVPPRPVARRMPPYIRERRKPS
jgi:hypothetical protein